MCIYICLCLPSCCSRVSVLSITPAPLSACDFMNKHSYTFIPISNLVPIYFATSSRSPVFSTSNLQAKLDPCLLLWLYDQISVHVQVCLPGMSAPSFISTHVARGLVGSFSRPPPLAAILSFSLWPRKALVAATHWGRWRCPPHADPRIIMLSKPSVVCGWRWVHFRTTKLRESGHGNRATIETLLVQN